MNRIIKKFAIDNNICAAEALDDPEGYDGYQYYDSLTKFIEQTKQYYTNRAVLECIDICEKLNSTQGTSGSAAILIKQHFGIKNE
jgi:hypothetical protein